MIAVEPNYLAKTCQESAAYTTVICTQSTKNGGLLLDTLIQSFCSVKAKKPEGKHVYDSKEILAENNYRTCKFLIWQHSSKEISSNRFL